MFFLPGLHSSPVCLSFEKNSLTEIWAESVEESASKAYHMVWMKSKDKFNFQGSGGYTRIEAKCIYLSTF